MNVDGFRFRAIREGERYGDDPFVFLRELAQNSRDAGASRISVVAEIKHGTCSIEFEDDGHGMSFPEARKFFFRLYASSKENRSDTAGRFGVGFWSVLRFRPESMEIESRKAGVGWAVRCAGDLSRTQEIEPSLSQSGTRIVLRRSSTSGDEDFVERVRERLSHYCRYLRRAGRGSSALPLTLNGVSLHEPMVLDGPVTMNFSSRDAEGVVGLGPEPRVELYSRGIWVTTVSVIEELDPELGSKRPVAPGEGLAPVVILNSNSLELVLSRDKPVDGPALRRLLRLARSRVDRLVEHAVDGIAPRSWRDRLADGLRDVIRGLGGPAAASILVAWALVLLLGGATLGLLRSWTDARSDSGRLRTTALPTELGQPYSQITGYRGATIDVPEPGGHDLSLTVNTDETLYFRALGLDRYDPVSGWQERLQKRRVSHPKFRCNADCVTVTMAVSPGGQWVNIPVPTGYRLDPDSVRWNSERSGTITLDDSGSAAVKLVGRSMGLMTYRVGPVKSRQNNPSQTPDKAPLSEDWNEVVRRHQRSRAGVGNRRALSDVEIAESITGIVRRRLEYDVSKETAQRFESHRGLWTERVMGTGAGDCDVKNGFNVLLFRRLNIPARLAVGIVAVNGKARGGFHAWTEYHADGRWWVADATGRPRATPRSRPLVGGPEVESDETDAAIRVSHRQTDRKQADAPVAESDVRPGLQPRQVDRIDAGQQGSVPARPGLSTTSGLGPIAMLDNESFQLLASGMIAVLVAALLWFARRRRVDETLERRGEGADQRAAVASMVRELLRGGAGWQSVTALGHRRVLPTLTGRSLSVFDAARRSKQGRLWAGRRRSHLARTAAAAGHSVIDLDDKHFGGLVLQTFDVVDLSAIERLSLTRLPDALSRTLEPLLRPIAGVTCVWSKHLVDRALIEYDLSELRLRGLMDIPHRAIVINPDHPDVRARIRLFDHDPRRALFGWVDWLVGQSSACEPYAARLRQAAARILFDRGGE